MKKIKTIDNAYFAVTGIKDKNILTYLCFTENPDDMEELLEGSCAWLDGLCLEDNCVPAKYLPTEPGFYAATLEFWFEQGYFEGYPANGESSVELTLTNVRKLEIIDPESK